MPLQWKCLARPRANVPTVGGEIVMLFCARWVHQWCSQKCRLSGNAGHDHKQMYLPSAVTLLSCFVRDGWLNGARKMQFVWKCSERPRANVPTVGSDIVILFCASCAEQFNANVPTVSSEFAILLGASMVRGKCRFSTQDLDTRALNAPL